MALVKLDFSNSPATERAQSDLQKKLDGLSLEDLLILDWGVQWRQTARRKQLPPAEFLTGEKPIWGLRSGRGFGKTLTAANWLGMEAALNPETLYGVIAPTHDDSRHTCTIADTLVFTKTGERRIVDIQVGDEVLTRSGWNRVLLSGKTGTLPVLTIELEDRVLKVTADHSIWVESQRRFLPASALKPGDEVSVLKSSSSTASYSDATPIQRNEIINFTSVGGITGRDPLCIERFGSIIGDQFRKAGIFIIERVQTGIELVSSSVLRHLSTTDTIIGRAPDDINGTSSVLARCERTRSTGIEPPKVESTLEGTLELCLKKPSSPLGSLASSVERDSSDNGLQELSTVQTAVVKRVGVESAERVDVYNLSVEGQPEFFANGILVHNCFQGVTGLLSVIPEFLIDDHNKALPSITLKNGSFIRGFAGDTPNRLRGPQFHAAWCEEIASWQYPKEAWSNIEFGLRLGKIPRMVWTSTPRPTPFMKDRNNDKRAIIIVGSTYENRANLTDFFYQNIAKYEGTAIGRQELWGEILDPEEAGFVKRSQWRLWPTRKALPKFRFLIMSLDTAFTDKTHDKKTQTSDYTACSIWGLFEHEKKDNVMLLDCWEDRLGFPQLVARVKKEMKYTYGDADEPLIRPLYGTRESPKHTGRAVDLILIEEKGSGISLRQSLASENIFTESYNPGKLDKLSRLHIVSPMFAAGRVWAVESESQSEQPRNWADPLVTQVCSFVGEGSIEYDDLLDTATQALRLFMDKFKMVFTVKVDPEELKRRILAEKLKAKKVVNPYGE